LTFDKVLSQSKTGIDVYNYVLKDGAFIDKNGVTILFYPRRKNELKVFWVNDSFAINKGITKITINWVKDIYLEQEFEVVSDSVFLLTKLMSDFALNKKRKFQGVYGNDQFL
jgi:hypothetical protein